MKKAFLIVLCSILSSCTGFQGNSRLNFINTLNMAAETRRAALPGNHIPLEVNERVQNYINKYVKASRGYFRQILSRAHSYFPMMLKAFREEGLPDELVYLPIIESEFRVGAYSSKKASGAWQFMKATGKHYGLEAGWWIDERRSAEKSTIAAAKHLRDLYVWLDDWYLALGAYNAGGGKIKGAIKKYKTRNFWELTQDNRSYIKKETKHYVPKFLAVIIICENLKAFGFEDIEKQPVILYDVVEIPDATDLNLVADLCGSTFDEIKSLNPELIQWATPPQWENYRLRIPPGTRDKFISGFSNIPATNRITFRRHKINSGESVWSIAKKYDMPRDMIIEMNSLGKNAVIREGHYLIIPIRGVDKAKEIDKILSGKES